jgi:6-pyruvoyltetrahydropterin/6-carboxytetrahydropterin synthase
MAYTLSKKFRFESAHRLANNYVGKCSNIHGHSWNGLITITVNQLDTFGFGLDFAELKQFIKPLEKTYDHAIFLNSQDQELIDLCVKNGWKHCVFEDLNPTSEVLAITIFNLAQAFLKHFSQIEVKSVTIDETCTSSCIFSGK